MNDSDLQRLNRDWQASAADAADDLFPICWHRFDWNDPKTHPPAHTPILVRFTEGPKGEHRSQAVVTFITGGMFGSKFDFRHSASYIEQNNQAQVRYWSLLPSW